MLNVPKTLCKCPDVYEQVSLSVIVPVDNCDIEPCDVVEPTELVPVISAFCPCEPEPEIAVNFSPKPRRTKIVKSCFTDFIKNMTSTKFCYDGPTCKVS